MIRRRLLLFSLQLFLTVLPLSARLGDWTVYPAYKEATRNVVTGEWIYSLSSTNLFRYHPETEEVQLFSRQNGLSDSGISQIAYCRAEGCLVIVYTNANIDFLYDDGSVVNLPGLMNSQLTDKQVNNLAVEGSRAYIAMTQGVEVVNVADATLENFYAVGNVRSTAIYADRLYASVADSLVYGELQANLLDRSNWHTAATNLAGTNMVVFRDFLYLQGWGGGLFRIGRDNQWVLVNAQFLYYLNTDGSSYLLCGNASRVMQFDASERLTEWIQDNDFNEVTRTSGGTYWASRGLNGLQPYALDAAADTLAVHGSALSPDSPVHDYCYYMTYVGDTLLVAGGSLNYVGIDYEGTVMRYAGGSWYNFPDDDIARRANTNYLNITSVAQDPADVAHHFATAAGGGLFEYRDGRYVKCYNLDNSPLCAMVAGSRYHVRTDGLNYDPWGNLWIINNQVDTILRAMRPDGSWKEFYDESIAMFPTCERTLFDSSGRLWVTSRRETAYSDDGLYCLDLNGTFENRDDDRSRFRASATNEDGTACEFTGTSSVVEDKSGRIWFGTATGPYLIEQPDEWFADDFTVTQVKVPRNDGTNYADYLLSGVAINAIAVDALDRKWFGTAEDGVFVTSPDGVTTVHHFTTENSPLPSNVVYSLAVNESTGVVMIGTDRGIVAYEAGTAADAVSISGDQIRVYPNPVRPGYYGRITVSGLPESADIKITRTGGQVVAAGTAVGGVFTWDGRDRAGRRVPSGVYFVMASTADGKEGAAAKITIVR